jgi:hypothetical protein
MSPMEVEANGKNEIIKMQEINEAINAEALMLYYCKYS